MFARIMGAMVATRSAALGVAIHSGWAAAVALGNSASDPHILLRSRIEMSDAGVPDSKQPYHAVESLELEHARQRLEAFAASAQTKARAAIEQLRQSAAQRGYQLGSLGILDSSGRSGDTLAAILASHTLIHTADGNHFRRAIASAAHDCGLQVRRLAAKGLDAHAQARLSLSQEAIEGTLTSMGRQIGAPWGADQKKAALLAWTLL
ncbi:MAG TPA: hypothetical protein VNZ06_02860 [Steroidobacteraceae bacterium]|nr:hypothetical protein [Steroidobacteraceae bacterium]